MAGSPLTLDAQQRSLVDLPATVSAAVIGAPGTGKTVALIERVAALVESGCDPDQVLVIAGSRQSAAALRDTIALRLARTTSGPVARTGASLAFDLVQAHLGRKVTLLTGAEHDGLLAELLAGEVADGTDGYWPEAFSAELRSLAGFRTELREFIMRTEEYGVTTERLRELAHARGHEVWAAVAEFVDRSVTPQAASFPDQFDAAELVAYAARLVRDGANLPGHEQLRVVLVDDAQDATESTISLLRAFAARGVAVQVFGVPDIASNGFRGGRADLLGRFDELLGLSGSERVVLTEQHRLPARIQSEYERLVSAIGTRGVVAHRKPVPPSGDAQPAQPQPIDDQHWRRLLSPSAYTEARAIAEELRSRHLLDDVPWSQLAVVTRSMHQALQLERSLGRLGVPTQRTVSRLLLRDNDSARWLLDAAQVAYEFGEPGVFDAGRRREQLLALLASPLGGFDQIELRRFKLELRDAGVDLVSAIRHPNEFDELPSRLAARAAELARTLNTAAKSAIAGSVEDVLWQLWSGSPGAAQWIAASAERGALADEANASLDAVVALFAAAQRFVERRPNESGTVFLTEQFEMSVPEDIILGSRANDTVTVATPSQLVGRQFDTVVIASLVDGVWPNLRPRFSMLHADDLPLANAGVPAVVDHRAARAEVRSDEYRLFALAMSRATHRVVLSTHIADDTSPSVLFGSQGNLPVSTRTPTRLRDLAAELRRTLVSDGSASSARQQAAAGLAWLASERVAGASTDDWYGLRALSTDRPVFDPESEQQPIRVSPSAIDKLKESSLAWFVDQFAPAPMGDAQSLGIIVHAAFEQLAFTPEASVEDYLELVLPEIDRLPVEAEWMRGQTERTAREMLTKLALYVADAHAVGRAVVGAEMKFAIEDGHTVVSGIIDRIERDGDGNIFVVDLKTGKSVPSVEEAQTHAQLRCYQLAVHLGRVEGLPEPEPLAGAALLYVQGSSAGPTLRTQDALTEHQVAEVQSEISEAATQMNGPDYLDYADIDAYSPSGNRRYRIQVIPAVSA